MPFHLARLERGAHAFFPVECQTRIQSSDPRHHRKEVVSSEVAALLVVEPLGFPTNEKMPREVREIVSYARYL